MEYAQKCLSHVIFGDSYLRGGGGGVQGQKSWKHDFEITGDPKAQLKCNFQENFAKMSQKCRNSKIEVDS